MSAQMIELRPPARAYPAAFGPRILDTDQARALPPGVSQLLGVVRTGLLDVEERLRTGAYEEARQTLSLAIACLGPTLSPGAAPLARGGLTPRQIQRLTAFVEDHLAGPIVLAEMAQVAGLSCSHFCRTFRESFGQPPQVYVQHRRIELAKSIMLETDEPLAAIALACGFSDQAALCKVFRRLTGGSPAKWRRAHRG